MIYLPKTVPRAHQQACWDQSRDREYYAFLYEMGAGKTKSLIDTAAYLYEQGRINGLLVFAPAGCYNVWPDDELPKHLPDRIRARIVTWRSGPSASLKRSLREIFDAERGYLHILVMNIEALVGATAQKLAEYFTAHHDALVAIDESTTIGNPSAMRTKATLRIAKKAKYRRIMTGDAAPNSPLTLWSQAEFLAPGLLGKSFFSFKARYCQQVEMQAGGHSFKQVVGYRDLDKLTDEVRKWAFIVRKSDCLDLPPKVYQVRHVLMSPKQARAYAEMRDQAMVQIDRAFRKNEQAPVDDFDFLQTLESLQRGETSEGPKPEQLSTANLVITQLLRLHQIACGFIVNDAGEAIDFAEENPKIKGLLDLLEEASGKVLIWSCYTHSVHSIVAAITKRYGPDSVMAYHGATSNEDRRRFKLRFQDQADPLKFGVLNQAAGSKGLTLTAAPLTIYYANDFNQENRAQSEDRNHRIGAVGDCVTYVDLPAAGTIEEKILAVLKGKKSMSEMLRPSTWRRLFDNSTDERVAA